MPLLDGRSGCFDGYLYSNTGDKIKEFEEQWKILNELTNKLETQKIVDIDAILMQFMYINRVRQKEYLNKSSVNVTVPGVRRYYTEFNKKLLDEPFVLCDEFTKIVEIWEKIKNYPIVKLLMKFNENVKLYLAGYLSRFEVTEITVEEVLGVCECLLRLFTILHKISTSIFVIHGKKMISWKKFPNIIKTSWFI